MGSADRCNFGRSLSSWGHWEQRRADACPSAWLDRREATTEGMVFTISDCQTYPSFDRIVSQEFATLALSSPSDIQTAFRVSRCSQAGWRAISAGSGLRRVQGGAPSSCESFKARQERAGRELYLTACKSCFFVRRGDEMSGSRRWQMFTSDARFKEHVGLHCQGNHALSWQASETGGREHPAAMVVRLVSGFVHDFRPQQLHMFLTTADNALIDFPAPFDSVCTGVRGGCDSGWTRACV